MVTWKKLRVIIYSNTTRGGIVAWRRKGNLEKQYKARDAGGVGYNLAQ
jgi:hypothetical protein